MNYQPAPYQDKCTDYLVNHDVAALFVGMGLGKTAATLAAISKLISDGSSKGVLVVAPLRVSVLTWPQEVAKWDQFRWMKCVSLRTKEGREAWERQDACIYTVNFESLPKIGKELFHKIRKHKLPVDTIIWDELTKAKSVGSKRINAFRKFRTRFDRHWGLTGTPIPNSHVDLFAQIRLLDGGIRFGREFRVFKYQYCEPVDYWQRKWVCRPECESMIEDAIADMNLTLRSEDHLDIPPTEVIDVPVTLPPDVQKVYKKLEKELIVNVGRNSKVKAVNRAVLVGKLQQLTSGAVFAESLDDLLAAKEDRKVVTKVHDAKIKALRSLYRREGKAPLLVAVRFTHERDRICKSIGDAVPFHTDLIPKWNRGEIGMMVAHPASMSHGLNLQQGGCRAVWASLTYSREEYDQFNARVARRGQKNVTKVFHLTVPGGIDDAILGALQDKGATQAGFLEACARNVKNLTENV